MSRERDSARIRDRLRTRAKGDLAYRPNAGSEAALEQRRGRANLVLFNEAWMHHGDVALEEWVDGGYPNGFLERAYMSLGVTDPSRVLHTCSGGVRSGITVDIRPEVHPMVVADARKLPFFDNMFEWAMSDPPYSDTYATTLYGTGSTYPRPSHLVKEMLRVLKPGGRCGLLHYIVPMPWDSWDGKLERVYGVWTGPAQAIRAWSVWQKNGAKLGL